VVTQNMFDQLQTASFIGGYNAVIRTSAPAMSHYVASGADPFLAVYCAIEGSGPPLISDVAMAVASKLTSAVLSRLSAARLLYAGHGIMGLGHVIRQGLAPPQHTLNCTLIQGDGRLKVISVPFHYALSDKHSRRVRDLHLLKKLTVIMDSIKSTDGDVNQVMEQLEVPLLDIFVDMRTPQLLRQGLQCLLGTVGCPCSLMLKAVDSVSQAVDNNGKKTVTPWSYFSA
ncbi:predicted protein, partial [Nematostella vectensis]